MHLRGKAHRWSLLLVGSAIALMVAPFAVAAGGDGDFLKLGKRNPSGGGETRAATEIIAQNKDWGTRQSNKQIGDGGGAIYGCRSGVAPNGKAGSEIEPCLRSNNVENGRAFEFNSQDGKEVGRITVGNDNADSADAKPFTTNAHGVATGLNADAVDGLSADDLRARFAIVSAAGALDAKSRGTKEAKKTATGTYEVTLSADAAACAFSAVESTVTDAGAVAVAPQSGTVVQVLTRDAGGAAADRPFHLTVVC
jgi:hypothetical protein